MGTQTLVILSTLAAFGVLGFMMSKTIKQHEKKMKSAKKKKGRTRYMQEAKKPGK